MSLSTHRGPPRARWRHRLTVLATAPALAATALVTVGLGPLAAAAHAGAAGGTAYIANLSDNSVSVVDTTTGTVTATVPVGSYPSALVVSPDGSRVYVADEYGGDVSVIDTATNTVTATIGVGPLADAVAISPDGSRLYVAGNVGGDVTPYLGGVSVIDTSTDTVTATIPTGNQPDSIAVTPDGTKAYVANFTSSTISVIGTSTDTVIATISSLTDSLPASVAISPDGTRAYVANPGSHTVSVIDTATNSETDSLPVSGAPQRLSISPDDAHVYVIENDGDSSEVVWVVDTSTNTVTDTIPIGKAPSSVIADPAGGNVYVTRSSPGTLVDIDTSTNTVTGTLAVGNDDPAAIAMATAPPVVTALSTSSGPAGGGNTVTITGTHLAGTTAVRFGARRATSFTLDSAAQITATAPAGPAGSTVDVTVTAPGGTSPAGPADHYGYAAADLAVTLAARGDPGVPYGQITYALTVANHGPSTVVSATITAQLPISMPAHSRDCATGHGQVVCTVRALLAGATRVDHFSVPIGQSIHDPAYTVTATRTASSPTDPNPANDRWTSTCTITTSLIIYCRRPG